MEYIVPIGIYVKVTNTYGHVLEFGSIVRIDQYDESDGLYRCVDDSNGFGQWLSRYQFYFKDPIQ